MQQLIQTLAAILLILALPFSSSGMTPDEAREDISWKADFKGLAETDKARILDNFDRLREFFSVREAHNVCLENIKHARPPAPESRPVGAGYGVTAGKPEGAQASEAVSAGSKNHTERAPRRSPKSAARPDGKLDHQLMGLDKPLFPNILEEAQ